MRLTLKLTIGLIVAILPVIAVNSGVRADREIDATEAELHDNDVMLGRTVAGATSSVWRSAGEAEARLLVAGANERQHRVGIRWTWLDGPIGHRDAPAVDSAALVALGPGEPLVVRGRRAGDDTDSVFTYIAVSTPDGRRGAIEVRRSLVSEQGFVRRTVRHAAIATGAVVGVCGCLALGLGALLVGRPVSRLAAQTRRIAAGDLSVRLRLANRDELGQLGAEVDFMCDRLVEARDRLAAETTAKLAALEQVRHADRLSTVGKLAAGIAHELGTPLNVISGHAQLLGEEYARGTPAHDNAAIVIEQTQRVAAIIRQLLDFARRRPPQQTRIAIGPLVKNTLALLGPLASERGIVVAVELTDESLACNAEHGQLQQAITNLVVNGLQATSRGGRLFVRVSADHAVSPPDVAGRETAVAKIEISDTGPGIDPDVLPHIFEPFFTTKDVGEGTGLGLSVTYGIVKDHDGWIAVTSKPGEGSRFAIYLPVAQELGSPQSEQPYDQGRVCS